MCLKAWASALPICKLANVISMTSPMEPCRVFEPQYTGPCGIPEVSQPGSCMVPALVLGAACLLGQPHIIHGYCVRSLQ